MDELSKSIVSMVRGMYFSIEYVFVGIVCCVILGNDICFFLVWFFLGS